MMVISARPVLLRSLATLVAALSLALCGEAFAAVEAVPEVTLFVDASDNTRLDDDGREQETSRTALDAGIGITSFTERSSLTFAPSLIVDAYPDAADSELEAKEYFIRAFGRRDGQKVGIGFTTDYAKEGILNAELEDATPDDPDAEDPGDVDSGRLVFFNEDRERLLLRGDLDFRLSERNVFQFQLLRRSVSYSSGNLATALSQRSDYEQDQFSIGVRRRVDELNFVSATVFVSTFEADSNANATDTVGVEGRFSRPVSPTWTFNLNAGVQRSDYNLVAVSTLQRIDNADTNYTFGTGFRKRAERGAVNFDIVHAVYPATNGFVVVVDEVRAYLRHAFTPRFGMELGTRFTRTRTLDDVDLTSERDFSRVDLGFEWALTRQLFLGVGYDFIRQEFVNENAADATSNTFMVGVTYRGMSQRDR